MPTIFRLLLAALLLPLGAAAQTIQLVDGSLLLAKVEDANGDGLRVKRLDNGGALELRWDQLSPGAALAIKKHWGLAGNDEDELLVRADEVTYYTGTQKHTIIGKRVETTKTHNIIRVRGMTIPIPIENTEKISPIDVPVAQIYTKDEYYALRLAQFDDPDSADKHMLLAEDLIRVRDYDHAGEHLAKAAELGNSRDPARLEGLQARLEKYKAAAKELEMLDRIIACRSRGTLTEFEKGVELIAQYETEFPNSRLKEEFDLEKKRFEQARSAHYSQQVSDYMRRSIQSLANKKIGEGLTLQQARDYAENDMSDDLFERAATQFRLEVEEAKQFWAERVNYPVGKRTEHFSYGVGSWVLGPGPVLKGTDVEAKKNKNPGGAEDDGTSRESDRIRKRIREAIERRNAARSGGAGQEKEETEEDWWNSASRTEKVSWLRAYYAEFGGQLVVTFAAASACVNCFGRGVMPDIGPDGKVVEKECFLCHGTKYMRSFKAY